MSEPEKPLALAADFPPATHDQWRKLVDRILKGAPFERLESATYDGLRIAPLYERAASAAAIPGRQSGAAWMVMQRIDHPDPAAANAQARDDLENGANGLVLAFAGSVSANGFGIDASPSALTRVLDGIALDAGIRVDLSLSQATRDAARTFAAVVETCGFTPSAVDLLAGLNPIGGFASMGRAPVPRENLAQVFAGIVGELAESGFRGPFAVADGRIVHNAGGSEAQELAFALACAVAYLRALEASGMPLGSARDAIYFRLSADADQFLTMAKFRAVRKLWARVEAACGLAAKPAVVLAETAWRMMTRRDPHVNMLRATIAVTAAALGGADGIAVLPHTSAIGLPDAFARRIVRNTQLVLCDESNLARVADPGAGSGALESLTQSLCAAAWALFQEIEKTGGVWSALKAGLIQRSIAAVRSEREKAVARGRDVLTGTNAFPDIHETPHTVLDAAPASAPAAPAGDSSIPTAEALPRIRLAEPFERLRDASDRMLGKTGARPKIFLANLGTPAEFTVRATFAKNFFEAGGIEAVTNDGFANLDDMVAALKASGASLACLCSSDEVYSREAVAAARALAPDAKHLYLAGRPAETDAVQKAGVLSFIYAGVDTVATLLHAYDILQDG